MSEPKEKKKEKKNKINVDTLEGQLIFKGPQPEDDEEESED